MSCQQPIVSFSREQHVCWKTRTPHGQRQVALKARRFPLLSFSTVAHRPIISVGRARATSRQPKPFPQQTFAHTALDSDFFPPPTRQHFISPLPPPITQVTHTRKIVGSHRRLLFSLTLISTLQRPLPRQLTNQPDQLDNNKKSRCVKSYVLCLNHPLPPAPHRMAFGSWMHASRYTLTSPSSLFLPRLCH